MSHFFRRPNNNTPLIFSSCLIMFFQWPTAYKNAENADVNILSFAYQRQIVNEEFNLSKSEIRLPNVLIASRVNLLKDKLDTYFVILNSINFRLAAT